MNRLHTLNNNIKYILDTLQLHYYTIILITKHTTEHVLLYCENPVWSLQVTFSVGGKKLCSNKV